MRFLELRLLACGPFSDFSLDLSGGDQGLHVIYGPNEAGKSSALRALTYLCFGFPIQLKDDFIHPYTKLRVGARIGNDRGEELDFVRRKATKSTLRDRDDSALIEDESLRHFLGDLDESRFQKFFGIDHAMLVQGGREIIEGNGDTGQILFSAGGANDLKQVLDGLKDEAERLFLPGARASRKLNQLFTELTEARRALRDNQLPAREWQEHHQALELATTRKRTAESELHEKVRERSRLERIGKALPSIAALADRRQEAARLSETVLLPADFSKRRQQIQEGLRAAEVERNRAAAKAAELQRHLDELAVPQALLDQRAAIEPLAQRLGVFRQAQHDRPAREAEARQHEEQSGEILRKLGQDLDLTAAESLHLPEAKRQRIRALGEQYVALVNEVEQWRAKSEESQALIEENHGETALLPPPRDVGPLSTVLQNTLRLGNIEDELSAARRQCDSSADQLAIALKQLPLWSGAADEIGSLPVPLNETIDRFEDELDELDKKAKDLQRQLEESSGEAAEMNQRLEALRLEFDLPSEADLQAARERRQQGWQMIRKALSGDPPAPDAAGAYIAGVGEGGDFAGAFEHMMETSDRIADRLRREADRVAMHAQLVARQTECGKRIAAIAEQLQSAAQRRAAKLAEWNRLWQPVCSPPLLPREMRSWSRKHSELVQQSQILRQHRDRVRQLQDRVADRQGHLAELLADVADAPLPGAATLEQLMAVARQALDESAAVAQHRRELGAESARLQKERKRAQDKLSAAQAKLSDWQEQWSAAIAELPLDARGGPSEANAVLDLLTQLSQQLQHIREKRRRITDIDCYVEQFARDVRAVALQALPELAEPKDSGIAALAADLVARLSSAVAADQKQSLLCRQLAEETQYLAAANQTIEQTRSRLSALCVEAKCELPAELQAAEERSDRRRGLEKEIQSLESRLRDLSAGQALAIFIADAQSIDADALEPQLRRLDEQIANLDRELKDTLGPAIGAEQHALELMDCSAKAADANERIQDILLQIAVASQEYARLHIALVTLRKGIERYREQHQGPIIQRSSELFSRLTLGTFAGLREDYDSNGRPELVAIRAADDRVVRMAEMSDGTADQLFLAVRLAWLSEYLDAHPAIPFIVDDILIRFDDDRSAATLQVLAELSARTQVILFTHHRHVVEIAQRTVDADTLYVHDLTAGIRLGA